MRRRRWSANLDVLIAATEVLKSTLNGKTIERNSERKTLKDATQNGAKAKKSQNVAFQRVRRSPIAFVLIE